MVITCLSVGFKVRPKRRFTYGLRGHISQVKAIFNMSQLIYLGVRKLDYKWESDLLQDDPVNSITY
jgi:hypothetical protein